MHCGENQDCGVFRVPHSSLPDDVTSCTGEIRCFAHNASIEATLRSVSRTKPFRFRVEPETCHSRGLHSVSNVLADSTRAMGEGLVSCRCPVFEAFPNAFLAVLLPDEEFRSPPALRRGQRFDWLYERAVATGTLTSTLSKRLDLPREIWDKLATETDRERRAALVCLLTAAFAAQGTARKVGDSEGGWFWLPPMDLWQDWAKDGLARAEKKLAKGESTPQKKQADQSKQYKS